MRKFLPFILIFGIYFLVKFILYLPLTVTEGTVIKIAIARDTLYAPHSHKYDSPYPVMQFSDKAGITHMTTDDDPGSIFFTYQIGDNVKLCYRPEHPEKARLYSFFTWWLPMGNFGLLILACLAWLGISRIFSKELND